MASDKSFVEFIVEQVEEAGVVTYRKMFGEYAIYVNGKVVGLVCDNQLFVKPTGGGRSFIGGVVEAPPYPGAKLSFLIDERVEEQDWISSLFRITAGELPEPKPKSKRRKVKRGSR